MIRANDAAVAPYLNNVRIVYHPSVFLIRLLNDIDALDERRKESHVDGFTKILEYNRSFLRRVVPLGDGKVALESRLDLLTIRAEGGSDTNVVYRYVSLKNPVATHDMCLSKATYGLW